MENLSPQVIRRVTKEVMELAASPPEGIRVFVNEEDITDIQATITGPGEMVGVVSTVIVDGLNGVYRGCCVIFEGVGRWLENRYRHYILKWSVNYYHPVLWCFC